MIANSTYINSFFIILLAVVTILGLFFIGRSLSQASLYFPVLLSLGLVISVVSLFNSQFALYMLIISMLLSPEILVSETSAREVTIRTDDLLLAIITFTWLAKMAINKELFAIRKTPLNGLLLIYTLICIFSTAIGIAIGKVSPLSGFFFVLKYFEYFIVYFMVVNLLESEKQAKNYIKAMIITCTIVALYGMIQIPSGNRVTAPFEGEHGEPGTLGGYLMLMMSLTLAFLVYSEDMKIKALYAGLSVLFLLPLLYTLSRATFMAVIPMFFIMVFFSKKKKFLVALIIIALLLGPFLMPGRIIKRIYYTFQKQQESITIGSVTLESSASARIESWKKVIKKWPQRPLLGYGVTGAGFIDGQYPRVLAETGILGLFIFLWILWRIFISALSIYRHPESGRFTQTLSLSLMAGVSGLIAHAMTTNTFIIVRIMEPFWFLTAIVIRLPELENEEEEQNSAVSNK